MMIKQLKKNVGKVFRLYPLPASLTWTHWPQPIPDEYNRWLIETLNEKRRVIRLSHPLGYHPR